MVKGRTVSGAGCQDPRSQASERFAEVRFVRGCGWSHEILEELRSLNTKSKPSSTVPGPSKYPQIRVYGPKIKGI